MRPEIFLDTGIFIAWLVREERNHASAAELFRNLSHPIATSLAVVSEAYTWFLHRFDEASARTFRLSLHELPIKLLSIDGSHHAAVERKLEKLRGLKLTYVDASSLVFLEKLRIKTVWGTDRDLAIEGAKVLPEEHA